MGNKDAALRKRQQIDSSRRTMFIAVAAAAFVAGMALVVSFFLVKQIAFHTRIISKKNEALSTIKSNITTIEKLKDNIRVLDTNQALNSVKINEDNSALQSILDALPAEANADALGSSMQTKFAGQVDGLVLESLAIDRLGGTSSSSGGSSGSSSSEGVSSSIGFTMGVTGSADALKSLLARFEKSIRVIGIDSIEIEAGSDKLSMTIRGKAYYEMARVIEQEMEVERP